MCLIHNPVLMVGEVVHIEQTTRVEGVVHSQRGLVAFMAWLGVFVHYVLGGL